MKKTILALSALSFIACKSMEIKPVHIPAGFDWQGHRGCRGLKPENSLPAFLHALSIPQVTTLELDLAVSKDRQLIVSHDPFFNPAICLQADGKPFTEASSARLPLYQLTAAEIRSYDCGSIGNPKFPQQEKEKTYKPAFREVVAAVTARKPGIHWNIEIKTQPDWDGVMHPPVEEFVQLVLDEIRRDKLEKQVTIQSFDVRALEAMHRAAPDIPLSYLVENADSLEQNLAKLTFTPDIFSPYYMTVNRSLVKKCHEKKIRVIPWTVNNVRAMRRLIRIGADGIITDYPNLISSVGG